VGFFGRLGSGNYGNDGSFEALLTAVRTHDPAARIDVMCSGPEVIEERYGVGATSMSWSAGRPSRKGRRVSGRMLGTAARVGTGIVADAWRIARWVRGRDVVLVPGMGTFESSLSIRPWEIPWALFVLASWGRLFRVPVAFVDVGAAPVPDRVSRALLAGALRAAAHRSFRDEYSRTAVADLGVDVSADQVIPDLAFALPAPQPCDSGPEIGVGVIAWYGATRSPAGQLRQARYEDVMVRLVEWLLDEGWQVVVLAGDDNDTPVAHRLVERAGAGRSKEGPAVRYAPVETLRAFADRAACLSFVVASRYHNVIGTLLAGRPVVAVAYAEKHRVLLEHYGLAEHCHPISDVDFDSLRASVATVASEARTLAVRVSEQTREDGDLLRAALGRLVAGLLSSEPALVQHRP
jgi:polysaccharide pyruvyl transferase WcaK-like protein